MKKIYHFLLFVMVLIIVATAVGTNVSALSKYGSTGNEVTQIQQKLSSLGFYNGAIDGIYGNQTKSAVIAFQKSVGLTPDGIAGSKTLLYLNRVEHPSFPNTIAGVIYQSGAFSCIDDGQINSPVSETSKRAAVDAINGWDPSGGCIYYYNPVTATSKWIRSRPIITTIGKHVFCL